MLKRTSNRRTSTFLMLTSQKKGSQETMSLTNYTSQIGQKNSSLAPHFSSYSGIVNMYYFNKFTPEELAPTPWCLPYPRVLLSPLFQAWCLTKLSSVKPTAQLSKCGLKGEVPQSLQCLCDQISHERQYFINAKTGLIWQLPTSLQAKGSPTQC